MYLVAFAVIAIFGVGLATILTFAIRMLFAMLDINARAHQELQQLAAQRRRR